MLWQKIIGNYLDKKMTIGEVDICLATHWDLIMAFDLLKIPYIYFIRYKI